MKRLSVLLFWVTLGVSAQAQPLTAASGVAVFRYADPGQPTMDIRVWGTVGGTGVYQVELGTNLLELLTLAGGPAVPAENDRTVQTVHVELIRDPVGARTAVLETTLEELTSEDAPFPDLQDGDLVVLTLESRQRFTWREVLGVTSSVASLALLVLRLVE